VRAGVYTRISRDDAGDGAGVKRQEEDCRALCEQRGWSVARVFTDNDISASSGRHRPAYQALLEALASGDLEAVVAWAPERLHRAPRELEDFLSIVEARNVHVETVKAGAWDVSSSHGRLVARMLGAVSRAESERTGERVKRAHIQAQQAGLWRGAAPFGFFPRANGGRLKPDPAQRAVVLEIASMAEAGMSLTAIAAALNARAVRPRRTDTWTHTSVRRLLASPALGGLVRLEGELRQAAFEGLMPAERWQALDARLAARAQAQTRVSPGRLTLLGGILECAEHENTLYGSKDSEGKGLYAAHRPGVCGVRVTREPIDDFVRRLVVGRLSRADAASVLLPPPEQDSTPLGRAEELRARRKEIASLLGEGLLAPFEAREELERIRRRLDALEVQSDGVIDQQAVANPATAWEGWSTVQRREAVMTLFRSLQVQHVGFRSGPRVDLNRVMVQWAA
jgi:site-specific DNA recombinase